MLRSLGARASRPQIGAADPTQRFGFIFRCVFESRNHEKARKTRTFESRISRILLDFTGKSFVERDSLSQLFFLSFFRVFHYSFAFS